MAGVPDRERLDQLAARIRAAENAPKPGADGIVPADGGKSAKMSRVGFDFVATIIACTLFGWAADWQLQTKPWGLLVMSVIGFATGVMNVWRGLNQNDQTIGWRKPDEK